LWFSPRRTGKHFAQGQLRSVTVLLGLGSKECRSIVKMRAAGNDIKVGSDAGQQVGFSPET